MAARILMALLSIMAVSAFVASAALAGSWQRVKDVKDPTVIQVAKFAVAEINKEKGASLVFDSVPYGEEQVVEGTRYHLYILTKARLIVYFADVYYPLAFKS